MYIPSPSPKGYKTSQSCFWERARVRENHKIIQPTISSDTSAPSRGRQIPLIFLLILIFSSTVCFAQDNLDLYTFASPVHKQRFYDLTSEFRCLVCQNQALTDSNAPLAQDMRQQILIMLNQGATNQEITDFLVKRYGEFVRYQPPFNRSTVFLWVMPVVLLGVGFLVLLRRLKSTNA